MFRPDLVGHASLRQRLMASLQDQKLPATLLFWGPEGIGKRRVAWELAQREACFQGTLCGRCAGCKFFDADPPLVGPNYLRLAPQGKAGLIGVRQVREDELVEGGLLEWVFQSMPKGHHRWVLIEEAHRMHEFAANILLKTLEEPPDGARFILLTHRPEALLATIRSRATRIHFEALDSEELWSVARLKGWQENEREAFLALSQGSLEYLDPESFGRRKARLEAWLDLLEGGALKSDSPLLPNLKLEEAQSQQVRQSLELLLLVLNECFRLEKGLGTHLIPWEARLGALGKRSIPLKELESSIHAALRGLGRNLAAEPLLRSLDLAMHSPC